MQDPNDQVATIPVRQLFGIGFILVLGLKLVLATRLDLYSDEIFYWLASTHPAIAYSDLPFMTALLAGLGNALYPGSAFAVRFLFILLGSCLPLLVYWVARPVSNQQHALESALLTLCLPLAAFLGLLAVPDVPLLVFGLLAIGFFERALRLDSMKYWLATGIAVALGLSTHYRFFLYPLAAILFLILYKPVLPQWRNPRLWTCIAIASLGLLPILWFNLNHQLSSASFYFFDRHPWSFQASGLLHIFKQAGLVTPLLYGVFLYTIWLLIKDTKSGMQPAALFLSFALTNLLVYMVLAPWTDATSTSIHWPLSGYIPLLVFVPAALRDIYRIGCRHITATTTRKILASIPALGFCGTLLAFLGIGSQGFQDELQAFLGSDILSNKMAGWKEFSRHTRELVDREFASESPVLITDNYYTAAQLEFAGVTNAGYTLDRDKAVRDGRAAQLYLWRKDETGLTDVLGAAALFITEDSTLDILSKQAVVEQICSHADQVQFVEELSLFEADKRFSFYRAAGIVDYARSSAQRFSPCPFPARAWLDFPKAEERLQGIARLSGWAFNEDIGIAEIYLLIDGERFERVTYGIHRPDVVDIIEVKTDPQAPALGIEHTFDTARISNGRHHLALEIVNNNGMITRYGDREIIITNLNQATAN